jgi:phytanoyl-CoA hydroxylase
VAQNSDNLDSIPSFEAPPGGQLTNDMVAAFEASGVIKVENFVALEDCGRLRKRAHELVEAFNPETVRSGDKIRFFFEDNAFDDAGHLRQSKHESLNKIGHAMHDLDPVFDAFSRTQTLAATVESLGYADPGIIQSMYIFKPPGIGGEVTCHQDRGSDLSPGFDVHLYGASNLYRVLVCP